MDCGSVYIKMCEKAEEIQVLRREEHNSDTGKWQPGDFWTTVFASDKAKIFTVNGYRDAWADIPYYIHHPIECIWLPRQDQLQEMVFGLPNTTSHQFWLISQLNKFFYYWDENGIPSVFFTWEQLWLAFVEKKNFGKAWTGESWER